MLHKMFQQIMMFLSSSKASGSCNFLLMTMFVVGLYWFSVCDSVNKRLSTKLKLEMLSVTRWSP